MSIIFSSLDIWCKSSWLEVLFSWSSPKLQSRPIFTADSAAIFIGSFSYFRFPLVWRNSKRAKNWKKNNLRSVRWIGLFSHFSNSNCSLSNWDCRRLLLLLSLPMVNELWVFFVPLDNRDLLDCWLWKSSIAVLPHDRVMIERYQLDRASEIADFMLHNYSPWKSLLQLSVGFLLFLSTATFIHIDEPIYAGQ